MKMEFEEPNDFKEQVFSTDTRTIRYCCLSSCLSTQRVVCGYTDCLSELSSITAPTTLARSSTAYFFLALFLLLCNPASGYHIHFRWAHTSNFIVCAVCTGLAAFDLNCMHRLAGWAMFQQLWPVFGGVPNALSCAQCAHALVWYSIKTSVCWVNPLIQHAKHYLM